MSIEHQKAVWDKNWQNQSQINPEEILNSRFRQEASRCLKNFINAKKDRLILEAGCGTGRLCCLLARDLPDSQVIGMDISSNALMISNRLKEYLQVPNVFFKMGDLFHIPYPDNYFDIVFNDGVIEHFPLNEDLNWKSALEEMIRVTKPKGKIIVDVPNWYCFPHTLYKWILKKMGKQFKYGYEKSFRHSELIKLFEEFNLINLELSGYYPAHGFYRLSGHSPVFNLLGKLIDRLDNKYIADLFGFMILIKGEKL